MGSHKTKDTTISLFSEDNDSPNIVYIAQENVSGDISIHVCRT